MKRFFIAAICSVASGNLLITLVEKAFNSHESLEKLQDILFSSESRYAAASAYPPDLLMNKIIAWALGTFVAGLVLNALLKQPNKWVNACVILFYLCAAYINIAIVPHPSWVAATVPALMIVPFAGGLGLTSFVHELKDVAWFKSEKDQHRHDGHMNQPAI